MELGYRGTGDPIKRNDFENRKRAAEQVRLSKRQAAKTLSSAGKDLSHSPFLQALADREEANRSGRVSVIDPL